VIVIEVLYVDDLTVSQIERTSIAPRVRADAVLDGQLELEQIDSVGFILGSKGSLYHAACVQRMHSGIVQIHLSAKAHPEGDAKPDASLLGLCDLGKYRVGPMDSIVDQELDLGHCLYGFLPALELANLGEDSILVRCLAQRSPMLGLDLARQPPPSTLAEGCAPSKTRCTSVLCPCSSSPPSL